MIKRIFWTLIIFGPIMFAGLWQAISGGDFNVFDVFNAGAVFDHIGDAWDDLVSLFSDDKRWLDFFWQLILVAYFIMPFIFVWRGLFVLGWIPFVGFALRLIVLIILIALPGLMITLANSAGVSDANTFIEGIILLLVLLGIWLPKKWTT